MSSIKPIVIVGLGKTGLSCLKFLSRQGKTVAVTDSRRHPPGIEECHERYPDCALHLGNIDPQLLLRAKLIVLSPGVSPQTPAIKTAHAAGIEIIGDIELFARHRDAPLIAITGTNGKSTVTTLVAELLIAAGHRVKVGGNLGTPALELLDGTKTDYYVLEISSFQLDTTESLRPTIATILNVTPDHLDRHANMAAYIQSKQRIYQDCEHIVYNRADRNTWPDKKNHSVSFGIDAGQTGEFGIIEQQQQAYLALGATPLLAVSELRLGGKHNWQNALAALAITNACGVSLINTLDALKQFPGLEHRCQWVAEIRGVTWYNDSKGTNVGACCAAIQGLGEVMQGKIVLIAGGQAKGASFEALQSIAKQHVRQAILIGEDAPIIAKALNGHVPLQQASDLQQAIHKAQEIATTGDSVLLSPACASFDSFNNFAHRGEVFTRIVQGLE